MLMFMLCFCVIFVGIILLGLVKIIGIWFFGVLLRLDGIGIWGIFGVGCRLYVCLLNWIGGVCGMGIIWFGNV